MRILVGWDDPAEAELISLYLNAGDSEAVITTETSQLMQQAKSTQNWDVILIATSMPDVDSGFDVFNRLRRLIPDCPIVGACHSGDVFRIARFMIGGMRAYLIRDGAGDFVFLLHSTLESTVEAVQAEREKLVAERLREEVESVRRLQESIIPQDLHSPKHYQICARYEPSQIRVLGGRPVTLAGGDYYDVFLLEDQDLVLLLGDASGHGMKACMSIMTMHTLIHMIRADHYRDTASFVSEINQRLCGQQIVNDEGGFITLLFGVLRADTHEFQWTSAGHPIPLLQDLEQNSMVALGTSDDGGLPLGIAPDTEYDALNCRIPENSRLLIYTDGLQEAFPYGNADHVEFGVNGIRESLKNTYRQPLDRALQALFDDSTAFTGGTGRHDDTSAILLERKGNDVPNLGSQTN